jgi:hypothetical protein
MQSLDLSTSTEAVLALVHGPDPLASIVGVSSGDRTGRLRLMASDSTNGTGKAIGPAGLSSAAFDPTRNRFIGVDPIAHALKFFDAIDGTVTMTATPAGTAPTSVFVL